MKKVVVIGGGTGTYAVLSALKKYPVNLTAIISMMDSGGSTGRLRDQLGVLPPGDIRQALVALSEESLVWRKLFTYRFECGDLDGHNFGNIFLSTIEKMAGSLPEAIKISQKLLKTRGAVLPVTLENTTLCAQLEDNKNVMGEDNIDALGQDWKSSVKKIIKCWISPTVKPTKGVLTAISKADFIIIGPGDLYTSILPNFLVDKVAESIAGSHAKKIFIVNLMNKRGQTDKFAAGDFIKELRKYAKKLVFDYILVNNGKIEKNVLDWYQQTCEIEPVANNLVSNKTTKVISANVVNSTIYGKTISDRIQRSLIRHDTEKLGGVLAKVMNLDFITP